MTCQHLTQYSSHCWIEHLECINLADYQLQLLSNI